VVVSEVAAHDDRVIVGLDVRRPAHDDVRSFFQVLFVGHGRIVEIRDYDELRDALTATPSPPPAARPDRGGVSGVAAILPVRDLDAALDHYGRLGFAVSAYEGGGYGYARRGAADFHLAVSQRLDASANTAAVYLHVDDADALYAEWSSCGVAGRFVEPEDTDYGLREGAHVDPDGNLLRFGSPLPRRSDG
jgi:catechol 2,3-dioxygenase-like lactoylglutathione lyase family enzyme